MCPGKGFNQPVHTRSSIIITPCSSPSYIFYWPNSLVRNLPVSYTYIRPDNMNSSLMSLIVLTSWDSYSHSSCDTAISELHQHHKMLNARNGNAAVASTSPCTLFEHRKDRACVGPWQSLDTIDPHAGVSRYSLWRKYAAFPS